MISFRNSFLLTHQDQLVLLQLFSNWHKRAPTSRFLIALLHHGGVKAEYFVHLLRKALEDVKTARHTTRDSLGGLFDIHCHVFVNLVLFNHFDIFCYLMALPSTAVALATAISKCGPFCSCN